jgi:uncharacterized protein YlaN (UPF0358 family)
VERRKGKAKDKSPIAHILATANKIMTLLTIDEKELLMRASCLMEELLETLEVMQDKELVKDLRVSLREAKQGKTITLDELVRDLHLETEVQS